MKAATGSAGTTTYYRSNEPEPHLIRTRQILSKYPEVRKLFGNQPSSALWITAVVALQIAVALFCADLSWGWILALSFVVGATANHAMFVMIHEATHNLVFKGSTANRLAGLLANLPIVFPSAMGFRKYHLLHHRYQGELDKDADLAGPIEAKLVGRDPIRKSLWLLFFFVIEGIVRPARLKTIKLWDKWLVVNVVVEVAFLAALVYFFGWIPFAYLALSTMFSIGLHPLGARWIQEHYVIVPGQETYSYYGPLNRVMFNVGFHNEHHDLMMVPWNKLPVLRKMAPDFYDSLHSHHSYVKLLLRFIFDPAMSLHSRVIRGQMPEEASRATQPVVEPAI